jgi:hypothetical protein
MSDIVERLRSLARKADYDEYGVHSDTELEAAQEIEKLRVYLDHLVSCIEEANAGRDALKVENEKLLEALQTSRLDTLEDAMEIAFAERLCVERYETRPPQAVAAHNIIEAIRALGEKE